ncbi:hypothetical protein CPR19092_LGOLGGFK_00785 [Companilactobacillus paralimentarius]
MGNKLRNIFTALIAGLTVIILVLTFNTNNVKAANNYTNTDMITSGSINKQDKIYSMSSTVPITYEYDTTGYKLENGDTLTIDVPSPLAVTPNDTPFNVVGDNGEVIGTAILNSSNQIVVTFNENVEELESVKGTLSINTGVTVDRNKAQVGSNDVDFNIKD